MRVSIKTPVRRGQKGWNHILFSIDLSKHIITALLSFHFQEGQWCVWSLAAGSTKQQGSPSLISTMRNFWGNTQDHLGFCCWKHDGVWLFKSSDITASLVLVGIQQVGSCVQKRGERGKKKLWKTICQMLNKGTDESSFPDHEWLTLNGLCNKKATQKMTNGEGKQVCASNALMTGPHKLPTRRLASDEVTEHLTTAYLMMRDLKLPVTHDVTFFFYPRHTGLRLFHTLTKVSVLILILRLG